MKLADFKGKVVLLTFSGEWCGPCNAMMPHEREIVEHFKDRPFAMVSVNSTESKEQLLKSIESKAITWRCWWDPLGDPTGRSQRGGTSAAGLRSICSIIGESSGSSSSGSSAGARTASRRSTQAVEALVKEAEAANAGR